MFNLRRSRWQFSLGSLLAFTAVMAICATLYGARQRAVQAQERAFQAIAARGGSIWVYGQSASVFFKPRTGFICGTGLNRVIEPAAKPLSFTDRDVRLFDDILKLGFVDFAGTAVTVEAQAEFAGTHKECHTAQ